MVPERYPRPRYQVAAAYLRISSPWHSVNCSSPKRNVPHLPESANTRKESAKASPSRASKPLPLTTTWAVRGSSPSPRTSRRLTVVAPTGVVPLAAVPAVVEEVVDAVAVVPAAVVPSAGVLVVLAVVGAVPGKGAISTSCWNGSRTCLLYTSDAADDLT